MNYLDYDQAPVDRVTHELYGPRQLALDFFKDDAERQRHERRSRETLRRFASMVGKGRLLEVGCAEGFFLSVARDEGWEPYGMDVEPQAAEYGREHFGVDIYCGPPGDAPWKDAYFDFVFMNNVMEHIVNPMEVLRVVHRVLRPGGVLYVRTGNIDSYTFDVLGSSWYYVSFLALGHLAFYSPRSMRYALNEVGFSNRRIHVRTSGIRTCRKEGPRWRRLLYGLLNPWAYLIRRGDHLRIKAWRD